MKKIIVAVLALTAVFTAFAGGAQEDQEGSEYCHGRVHNS